MKADLSSGWLLVGDSVDEEGEEKALCHQCIGNLGRMHGTRVVDGGGWWRSRAGNDESVEAGRVQCEP